jgi:hypothetical protein
MPVIPFIPAIIGGVSSIVGGKMATSAAQQRSPEEQVGLQGAQQAGSALTGMGKTLFGTGTGMVAEGQSTLAQPTGFYRKLLTGSRALMSQAISQPRAAISDVYRGAERGLEQGGVRGAQRDVARGELSRQKAGQIGSLITGVQPGAAAALTGIGQNQVSQGAGIAGTGAQATGASGNIYAGLLGQGSQNRQYARSEGENFGSGFGGLVFDLLSGGLNKGKGGGGGGGGLVLPSRNPWPTNVPINLPSVG